MTTARAVVSVVPGDGILVRRPNALFFSPVAPGDGRVAALLEAFETAPDDALVPTAVTDAVVAAAFDVAPFAVVGWTGGLELAVLGAVDVVTDHPALPMLSGAGSGSWVERRLGTLDAAVTVSVGGPAEEHSDLALGRVRAGGFAAIVTPAVRREAAEPTVRPTRPVEPPATASAAAIASADASGDSGRRLEGLAALHAATGGDWMEESLGLGPPGAAPTVAHAPDTASPSAAAPSIPGADALPRDVDDEVTLGGDDKPLPSATRSPPAWPGEPATAEPDDTFHDNSGHDNSGHDNSGHDNSGGDIADPATGDAGVVPAGELRLVPSRHCPKGHPNPPLADVCRACGTAIDAAALTVAIPQSVLGRLVLADGEASLIDRALVLGRRPDATAARVPSGSHLIAVGPDATVSRTHAVVRADGWTVTVTDCGSRSGTAVLMAGGDEPVLLQPWIPHEVTVGAQIFLGGPTAVSIEPVSIEPSAGASQ